VDTAAWLKSLGLEQYEPAFRENAIDADVLPKLTAEDLKDLGISAVGHRRKLLEAIAALRTPAAEIDITVPRTRGPVAPDGERRQVTVLFADLVGYTRLSREIGAEEVHSLLDGFFAVVDGIVTNHGGYIDKHIGDSAMAVFGAPIAHGNDTERAVHAALAIRDAMPGLAVSFSRDVTVHIGLACGQVVASDTGSSGHREYTVTGDSVNLASRLTDAAKAGEILIPDMVVEALSGRLQVEAAGAVCVKGFDEPIRTWRLAGLGPLPDHHPLVDRKIEVRQFVAALQVCRETAAGHVVHVRGEAGIGKTRLAEEFQRLAREAGFACHTGLVLDFGTGAGRDAIRALVRGMLGLEVSSDATAARAAAEVALGAGLVDREDAVFLNDLLDLPQPTEQRAAYDAMNNAMRIEGKQRTLFRLAERASRLQPRLLIVEDLHWADKLTLTYLAELTKAAPGCPLLVLTTTRIQGEPPSQTWHLPSAAPLITIDLGPLHDADARALADALVTTSAGAVERCIARAAGNPLFLEQLLRHAEESADTGVPGSIKSLVQARLDQLGQLDRTALQTASVLGQRFSPEALRYLLAKPDYAVERLVAHHLMRPHGGDFLFAHALIRDAIYDGLLKTRRRDLHRKAATWFALRDLVLHAEHLECAEDPEAARGYLAAARAQAGEYRYETALRLARRGLTLATDAADRFALQGLEADFLHDLGSMKEALSAYERAFEIATSDADRCRAWIGRAAVKRVTDDVDGAFADLDRAETVAAGQGLVEERARIHYMKGNLFFPRGNIEGCLKEHTESLQLAREVGAVELEAAALGGLGDAEYMRGHMISAHARLRECLELSREHGLGRIEVANLAQMIQAKHYFAPQQIVLAEAQAAVNAAARVGHHRAELNANLAAATSSFTLGQRDHCHKHIRRAHQLVRRLGARRFEQSRLVTLGRLALAEGHRAEAINLLQEAVALSKELGRSFHGAHILGALATTLEEPGAKRRALSEAEALIDAGCFAHNQLRFYPDAMNVALELGDLDEIERYAKALEDFTKPEPLPWADFLIARGRALAAHARSQTDWALTSELQRLRDEGLQMGFIVALPAIEAALTA
jgi:class 3 adenylate cyclase/tetratricopeptide (TPR) repeat protein